MLSACVKVATHVKVSDGCCATVPAVICAAISTAPGTSRSLLKLPQASQEHRDRSANSATMAVAIRRTLAGVSAPLPHDHIGLDFHVSRSLVQRHVLRADAEAHGAACRLELQRRDVERDR